MQICNILQYKNVKIIKSLNRTYYVDLCIYFIVSLVWESNNPCVTFQNTLKLGKNRNTNKTIS